jgi:hypothetical protein
LIKIVNIQIIKGLFAKATLVATQANPQPKAATHSDSEHASTSGHAAFLGRQDQAYSSAVEIKLLLQEDPKFAAPPECQRTIAQNEELSWL